MRRFRSAAFAAIALSLLLSQWVAAQALNLVPADTLFFVKINNAQQVSQKFANYTTELGIAQFQPALQDPIGEVKTRMGIQQGLREDGDVIFAFVDPQTTGVRDDQSMILLLPIADYDAFLGNFEGVQTEGDVSQFHFAGANGGQPSFAAHWGEYAAISPARELVSQQPQTGVTVEGLAARQLDGQDAVFYANIEKMAVTLLPQLRENRERIVADIRRELDTNPQQQRFAPVVTAAIERALDISEAFLEDAQSATWSLHIGERGLNTTWTAEFKPDTYGARAIADLNGENDALITGLPEGEYLMYGGSAVDPQLASRLFDDLLNPVIAALGTIEGGDAATASRFVEAMKTYYGSSTSQSWGMLAPTAALGEESLVQTVVVARGDAEQLRASQKDLFQLQNELMQAFSGEVGQEMTINITENATTVGDVQLDRFTTEINLDANSPEAAQAEQALAMIYGPGGLGGYTGVVDGKLITATGVPEARMQEVIDAAKAEQNHIAGKAHIQAVADELPEQRVAVAYVALDQWVSTIAVYAAQFGLPVQVQLQPDLPPIGVSLAGEGEALRLDVHVPTDLVQSLVAAGMQVFLGAMAPGGPGGPGGL